jgi:hypothetical protein
MSKSSYSEMSVETGSEISYNHQDSVFLARIKSFRRKVSTKINLIQEKIQHKFFNIFFLWSILLLGGPLLICMAIALPLHLACIQPRQEWNNRAVKTVCIVRNITVQPSDFCESKYCSSSYQICDDGDDDDDDNVSDISNGFVGSGNLTTGTGSGGSSGLSGSEKIASSSGYRCTGPCYEGLIDVLAVINDKENISASITIVRGAHHRHYVKRIVTCLYPIGSVIDCYYDSSNPSDVETDYQGIDTCLAFAILFDIFAGVIFLITVIFCVQLCRE